MKKLTSVTLRAMITAMLLMIICALPAQAATRKRISSVKIKLSNTLESGQYLDDFYTDVDVTVGDSAKYVYAGGEYTQSSSHVVKVGEEVKAKIYLICDDDDYRFSGSYTSSNVHVSNGTFVSASRKGDDELVVTVKLKAVSGQYDTVDDAYWGGSSLGYAKWDAPDDSSGYYDLILYRGSSAIYQTYSYKGTSLNLYPMMTKEGDYYFKVRVVPKASGKGTKSDWLESETQYVDKNRVSDGSGQANLPANGSSGGSSSSSTGTSSTSAGWVKNNGSWYYVYPDGTTKKNGWEKITNYWYYFGSTGELQKGWLTLNNQTYYLDQSTGVMQTGWTKIGDLWYYLNPDQLSDTQGAVVKNNWVTDNGNTYYMTSTGTMAVGWNKIGDKYYYFNETGDGKGTLVRNSYVGTFYVGADGAWIQNY
jgi:glucan-binding YG repeat protein